MAIQVFNENALGFKMNLGTSSVLIISKITEFNKDVDIDLDLHYTVSSSKSFQRGTLHAVAHVHHFDPNYGIHAKKMNPLAGSRAWVQDLVQHSSVATIVSPLATLPIPSLFLAQHTASIMDPVDAGHNVINTEHSCHVFKLHFFNINVSDLFDVGTMFDKQDPMLVVTIGKTQQRTERFVGQCGHALVLYSMLCYVML